MPLDVTGLAGTVTIDRHPRFCSAHFASESRTGSASCDCGLASETTNEGLIQHDLSLILDALGLGSHARPESPHMVVHDLVLPAIRKITAEPSIAFTMRRLQALGIE